MGRRANDEGSIFLDKHSKLYYGQLPRDADGRRPKTHGCKTRREASVALADLRQKRDKGIDLSADKMTVAAFLTYWLEHVVKPARKTSTYRSYEQQVRNYLVPLLGTHRIAQLTTAHVRTMVQKLRGMTSATGSPLSDRSVQYIKVVLQSALETARAENVVLENVAARVSVTIDDRREIRPLETEEVHRFLASIDAHRLAALYHLALKRGLREGELLGLRWSNIDFARQQLEVRRSGAKTKSAKTRTSRRTVPLSDELTALLRRHWELQLEERAMLDTDWKEHNLVFPSSVGTPISPRNLVRQFKTLLERAGISRDVRFHDLRHSCASLMIAEGVPLVVIKELLGHSQIAVTADIYGHLLEAPGREATNKLDRALERKAK